jgi:hypothetical protein
MERTEFKPSIDVLILVGLLIVALAARLIPGPRMVDDAHITFRYARHIVEGVGFVYNPGERVLGTTTPLYTLLLAGLSLLTGSPDFPRLAYLTNALTGALAVGLLYLLGRRFTGHRLPAAGVALLWAVAPYGVTFAIGGMETELTIALLLGVAYAHVTERPYAMAALSALAVLARPDTALLLVLVWLSLLLARKAIPWREGLLAAAILAPWLIFSTWYFGSPLTNSIAAKSVTYRLPPEANLVRLIQHYSTPFFEQAVLGKFWQLAGFFVYLLLAAVGSLRALRRERRFWPIALYPYLYFLVFAIANPLLFRWYFSPPMPFYFLLIVSGVWALAQDLGAALESRLGRAVPYVTLALFLVAALATTLNAWTLHPDHGPERPAPEMAWFKLELLYRRAADVVRAHAEPKDTLCAGDIGVLGYYTRLPILDTVGLVTPQATRHYPANPEIYVINYAIPADLVLDLDPDHIVILEVYGRLGLLPDERFQARYQLLETLETDIYGSDGMLIFTRR